MEPIAAVFCLCFVSSSRIPLSIKPTIQVCNYTLYTLYFSIQCQLGCSSYIARDFQKVYSEKKNYFTSVTLLLYFGSVLWMFLSVLL